MYAHLFKAETMYHADGAACMDSSCKLFHKTGKADIGSSDLAVAGKVNPEQNEVKAPGKKMKKGFQLDRPLRPKHASKKDSTRPLPRMDTGLSAPILTGSFAAGKGQSTMGVGGDRYDPTMPGKYPSVKDPVSRDQESAPVGPTYVGVFEKSKNLSKKIKLEDDQTAGNKPAADKLTNPSNPATLGKGATQQVSVKKARRNLAV